MTPKKLSLIILDHLPDEAGTHHGSFTGPSPFGTLKGEYVAEITNDVSGNLISRSVSITECYYVSGDKQTEVDSSTVDGAERELMVDDTKTQA